MKIDIYYLLPVKISPVYLNTILNFIISGCFSRQPCHIDGVNISLPACAFEGLSKVNVPG